MVKHIILWKLREDMEKTEIPAVKSAAKAALEGLFGKIDGLCEIRLKTEGLPSSNADMMLITVFKDEESLKGYRKARFTMPPPINTYARIPRRDFALILKNNAFSLI